MRWRFRAAEDMIDAFIASGLGKPKYVPFFYPLPSRDPISDHPDFALNWSAAYNLSRKFRINLAWIKIPRQAVRGYSGIYNNSRFVFGNDVEQRAHGSSSGLFIEFVPNPVSEVILSRAEVAIGAGMTYNTVTVTSDLDVVYTNADFHFVPTFSKTAKVVGGYAQSSFDYYVTKGLSLQFKLTGRFIPALGIPSRAESYDFVDRQGKRQMGTITVIKSHALNFSSVDFSFGLRLHF